MLNLTDDSVQLLQLFKTLLRLEQLLLFFKVADNFLGRGQ